MKPFNLGPIGGIGIYPDDFTRTHCKTNGPSTSQKAAQRTAGFYKGQCAKILTALRIHGPMTAKELALTVGYSSVQISRRLPDLERDGMVTPSDAERGGCREWQIKEAA